MSVARGGNRGANVRSYVLVVPIDERFFYCSSKNCCWNYTRERPPVLPPRSSCSLRPHSTLLLLVPSPQLSFPSTFKRNNCKEVRSYNGYRGCQSTTVGGQQCQSWHNQWPQPHEFSPIFNPTINPLNSNKNAKTAQLMKVLTRDNYCANPDGRQPGTSQKILYGSDATWCLVAEPGGAVGIFFLLWGWFLEGSFWTRKWRIFNCGGSFWTRKLCYSQAERPIGERQ